MTDILVRLLLVAGLAIGSAVHKRGPAQGSLQIVSEFRLPIRAIFRTFRYVLKCNHRSKTFTEECFESVSAFGVLSRRYTDLAETIYRPYTDLLADLPRIILPIKASLHLIRVSPKAHGMLAEGRYYVFVRQNGSGARPSPF